MTVSELIKALQEIDNQDLEVVFGDYETPVHTVYSPNSLNEITKVLLD